MPALNEVSSTKREIHNRHDCYAIAVMKRLPGCLSDSVVGHLPRSYCNDELFTEKRKRNGGIHKIYPREIRRTNRRRGYFPDATQTILDSLKSLSDDEADDTDDDEEQPIDS